MKVQNILVAVLLNAFFGESLEMLSPPFLQILDHLNPSNNRTWMQQYYVDEEDHRIGGPVYLFIGDIGDDCEPTFILKKSHMRQLAIEFNAVAVMLEPRYFGRSKPTDNLSFDNLAYLTIEQNIEDLVRFIKYLKTEYSASKVIIFGAGHGASYAVWLHEKFSSLVNGVIAYSAQVKAEFDFAEYIDFLREELELMPDVITESCWSIYRESLEEIKNLITSGNGETLQNYFKLPEPIDTADPLDIGALYLAIVDYMTHIIVNADVSEQISICEQFQSCRDYTNSSAEALGQFTRLNNWYRIIPAVNYHERVTFLSEENWSYTEYNTHHRQQFYMACHQASWFHTSENTEIPTLLNKFRSSFFVQLCRDVFGDHITEKSIKEGNRKTNSVFGGNNITHAGDVLFLYSQADPNRLLAPSSKKSDDLNIFVVPRVKRLFGIKPGSTAMEIEAKEMVREFVMIRST